MIINDILKDKKITSVVSVSPDTAIIKAVETMNANKIGSILVMEGPKLLGLFTERDLMHKIVGQKKDPNNVLIKDVMTTKIAIGSKDMKAREAAELMTQNRIRHLPILEDGSLIGVISTGDILAVKLKEQEFTIRQLESYIQS